MNEINLTIIEDKPDELDHLKSLLQESDLAEFHIQKEISTLSAAIQYFKSDPKTDLVIMDIQLPDGVSFDIFKSITVEIPIIFTSTYEHYVLQAIKVNGIDYLIKPIQKGDLHSALKRFLKQHNKSKAYELDEIKAIVSSFVPKSYKSSFLVNYKQKMVMVGVSDVAYCYVKEKGTFIVTHGGQEYLVDYYLDQLENDLDPNRFYRINRQYLMSRPAIKEIENYFNGRLLIKVYPEAADQIIISKKKVSHFKEWADS